MPKKNVPSDATVYDDPDFPIWVVYVDLTTYPDHDSGWRWRRDISFIIVNNGTAQVNLNESIIHLLPGQAIFINHYVMHSISQFGDDPCCFYALVFNPDYILGDDSSHIYKDYFNILDKKGISSMLFDENVPWQNELIDNINLAISLNAIKASGYELATKGYLCLFWSSLISHVNDAISSENVPMSSDEMRVKTAMSFIREHYTEKLSLDEIATHIHISKSECCRCFKRTIGMTPFEYLMQYRIFESSNMLRDPLHATESIADIAYATGFNNLSYFSKLFGKYMHCSPRQYRNDGVQPSPSIDMMSLR